MEAEVTLAKYFVVVEFPLVACAVMLSPEIKPDRLEQT